MKHWISFGAGVAFVAFAIAACSDDAAEESIEEVQNSVDCAQICAKYDDCVADIDETACADSCEDLADSDESYESAADACENCVEDKACSDAASCWANCPVVPAGD